MLIRQIPVIPSLMMPTTHRRIPYPVLLINDEIVAERPATEIDQLNLNRHIEKSLVPDERRPQSIALIYPLEGLISPELHLLLGQKTLESLTQITQPSRTRPTV